MRKRAAPAMDRRAALERLDGDAELLDEMIVLTLSQSRGFLGDIDAALACGDTKAVLLAAHTIRGSAATLEAAALAAAALELETMARRNDLGGAAPVCGAIAAALDALGREC